MPNISTIVALTHDNKIGEGPNLLFRFKSDLVRFRKLTINKPCIMGRKTFESIGRPDGLPDRTNIVLTRKPVLENSTTKVLLANSIHQAMHLANLFDYNNEIMVMGGGEVYEQFLPFCNKQYITIVSSSKYDNIDGCVKYPEWRKDEWDGDPETDVLNHEAEIHDKEQNDKIFFLFRDLVRVNRVKGL